MLISILCLSVWSLGFLTTVLGTWHCLKQFKRPLPYPDAPASLFPISILKPVKGVDFGLRENLQSFFEIEYPEFEILFSVADHNDPAIAVIESVIKENPGFAAKLIVGEVDVGPNPKVNNLIRSYQAARYDWVLISDSNTRVDSKHLRRLVGHLTPGVGVVTAVVAGGFASGWGGRLEASYLNTFFARWTHLAAFLGKPFVIGKSMCFQKSTAARFGGIQTLGSYIAEDNMLGQAVIKLGLKVTVMRDPIQQVIGTHSFKDFWFRHVRWGRIRKSQAPGAFLFEPLVTCFLSGLIGAWGGSELLGISVLSFLSVHLVVWVGCDLLMIQRLEHKIGFKSFSAWVVRELLAIPLWVHMGCGNSVNWRGSRLKILPGGLVQFAVGHRIQKLGAECHLFGEPQPVVIKLKETTNSTIGGNGNLKAKLMERYDPALPPITGIASMTT